MKGHTILNASVFGAFGMFGVFGIFGVFRVFGVFGVFRVFGVFGVFRVFGVFGVLSYFINSVTIPPIPTPARFSRMSFPEQCR